MRWSLTVRIIWPPTLALVVGVTLTGCQGVRSGPGAVPDSGTIVWLANTITETSNSPRQPLIDAFERAYPSIRVELSTLPDSTDSARAALTGDLSGGSVTTGDVYLGDTIWPYQFGHDGYALPLDRYLPASFWSRFGTAGQPGQYPLVTAAKYNGHIYAVPFFVDEGFLYYRKDLLARARLRPPVTWEQLEHDAAVLKARHMVYQFAWQGDDFEGLTAVWTEMLADAYGGLGTQPATAEQTAAELDSPQALKALLLMRRLIGSGVTPPQVTSFEEPNTNNYFDTGQAAFQRGWSVAYETATSPDAHIAADDVGVLPMPAFAGQAAPGWSAIGGWDLFINPHTRNLRAALTFVSWMTGPQAQRILATQYGIIPANARVRDDPAVIQVSPVLQAAAHTRLVSRPSASTDYSHISDLIHRYVHMALVHPGMDPCLALISAARAIDQRVAGSLPCATSRSR
ncbi:MAG: extracellular solute-binding protein [Streptosporangiaceae bacterium]|nr:extracellular solute-binding protein [Streptosporangiaceae bacterium]